MNLAGESVLKTAQTPAAVASSVKWAGFAPFIGINFVKTGPKVRSAQADIPNIEWGQAQAWIRQVQAMEIRHENR